MSKQITLTLVLIVAIIGGYMLLNRQAPTFGAITPYQIVQGGTGASSFAKGVLIGMNSVGTAMIATGTPQLTVGNLLATTTGISMFGGSTTPAVHIDGNYNQLSVGGGAQSDRTFRILASNPSNIAQDSVIKNTNLASGFGSYFIVSANSNYSSIQLSGTGQSWAFGQFGDTSFRLYDATNNKTPILVVANAPDDSLRIRSNGSVGVASSTPWGLLSINPNALGSGVPEFVIGSSTATRFIINGAGNIGIATSSPTTPFSIQTNHASNIGGIDFMVGDINTPSPILISHKNTSTQGSLTLLGFNVYNNPAGATVVYNGSSAGFVFQSDARSIASPSLQLNAISTAGVNTNIFTGTQGGAFGVATTVPWRTLSVVGTVAFNGLTSSTAGNAVCILGTFDVVTAGNTTCVTSSKYTKDNITNITDEEAMVVSKMQPVKYTMKSTGEWRYGFIAEEVEKLDPLLIERAKQDINIDGHLFKKGDVLSFDYLRYTALLTRYTQIIAERNGVVPQGKSNAQLWYIIIIFAFIYQQVQIIKLKK